MNRKNAGAWSTELLDDLCSLLLASSEHESSAHCWLGGSGVNGCALDYLEAGQIESLNWDNRLSDLNFLADVDSYLVFEVEQGGEVVARRSYQIPFMPRLLEPMAGASFGAPWEVQWEPLGLGNRAGGELRIIGHPGSRMEILDDSTGETPLSELWEEHEVLELVAHYREEVDYWPGSLNMRLSQVVPVN